MSDISRRNFLKLGAIAGASAALGTTPAFAEVDKEGKVLFTEEVAQYLAQSFLEGAFPDKALKATSATRLYSENGKPFGYVVNFETFDGEKNGYVIFDGTRDGALYEFSFDKGAKNPVEHALEKVPSMLSAGDEPIAIVTSPFTYEALVPSATASVDAYGTIKKSASTPDSSGWNDIFISLSDGYSILSMNNAPVEFISFSESEVENATDRYACAVSALLNCAPHYVKNFSYRNWPNDYLTLWSATKTTTDHTSGGITYGSTNNANIGSGFKSYCSGKGVSISYSNSQSPSFSSFKNMINRGDMGIFCCGINIDGSRHGHAMAVEGYATLKKGTISENIDTLIVADGWYYSARYLSFYYTKFTDTYGVFFS